MRYVLAGAAAATGFLAFRRWWIREMNEQINEPVGGR
jgi:hypothetical protein